MISDCGDLRNMLHKDKSGPFLIGIVSEPQQDDNQLHKDSGRILALDKVGDTRIPVPASRIAFLGHE
jgi:hypothetical protein